MHRTGLLCTYTVHTEQTGKPSVSLSC